MGGGVPKYNHNFLINPTFKINQRGKSEYYTAGSYTYAVDGWTTYIKLTVEDNSIIIHHFTEESDYWRTLIQKVYHPERFNGQIVTTSTLFQQLDDTTNNCFASLTNNTKGWWDSGNKTYKKIGPDNNGLYLSSTTRYVPETCFSNTDECNFGLGGSLDGKRTRIYAAKLELGEESTLAYVNRVGNLSLCDYVDYDEEYKKCCTRVFNVVSNTNSNQGYFTHALAYEISKADGLIPLLNNFTIKPIIEEQKDLYVAGVFSDGRYSSNVEVVASVYGYSHAGIQVILTLKDANTVQYIPGNHYAAFPKNPQTTSKLLFRLKK